MYNVMRMNGKVCMIYFYGCKIRVDLSNDLSILFKKDFCFFFNSCRIYMYNENVDKKLYILKCMIFKLNNDLKLIYEYLYLLD